MLEQMESQLSGIEFCMSRTTSASELFLTAHQIVRFPRLAAHETGTRANAVSDLHTRRFNVLTSWLSRATEGPMHSLAGVDAVLTACRDYCRAAFMLMRSGLSSGRAYYCTARRVGNFDTR